MSRSSTIDAFYLKGQKASGISCSITHVRQLRNSAAVAIAPPVIASNTTLSLLLLLAADIVRPVKAPPIIAFFCKSERVLVKRSADKRDIAVLGKSVTRERNSGSLATKT